MSDLTKAQRARLGVFVAAVCGLAFVLVAIPLGLRVHRWHVLGLARETPSNVARWYAEIKARPAFNVWTADPAHHLEG